MLADWFWPLHHYSLANHVPYGYQNWSDATRHLLFGSGSLLQRAITVLAISPCFLVPALPLAAVALLIYWLVQMWRKREPRAVAAHYVLVCCRAVRAAAVGCHRQSGHHSLHVPHAAFCPGAGLDDGWARYSRAAVPGK